MKLHYFIRHPNRITRVDLNPSDLIQEQKIFDVTTGEFVRLEDDPLLFDWLSRLYKKIFL